MNRSQLRRWVQNVFRALHIAGLIGTGAAFLGGQPNPYFPLMLLVSGVVMVILDVWTNIDYVRQVAGLWLLIKMGFVAWLVLDTERAPILFWGLMFLSVLAAHAPAGFRHRIVWGHPKVD